MQKVQSGARRLHGIKLIASDKAKENIFFFGFAIYLISRMWTSTEFVQNGRFMQISLILLVLCMVVKILFYDRYTLKDAVLLAAVLAVGAGIYIKTSDTIPIALMLIVFGAKGIDPVKIIKVHACIVGAMLIIAIVGANLEIINNWQYFNEESGNTETAFGIINTTDFAAHVCFLWLEFLYIKEKNLRFYHYFIGLGGAYILFSLTGARIDSACMALATILFLIDNHVMQPGHMSGVRRLRLEKARTRICAFAMPVCMAIMFIAGNLYNEASSLWQDLNEWSSLRLELAKEAFGTYNVTPFGKAITLYGNGGGGKATWPEGAEYNFLDISYQNMLYTQGVILLILFLLAYFCMAYKKKKDRALLLCILVISINCMLSHHLVEIAYVPFTILLFAQNRKESDRE